MSRKSPKPPGSYEVGHGKPPKHSRFKKGQSGNPSGRKRGSKNLATIIAAVAESDIVITRDGERTTVSMAEAVFMSIAKAALGGNVRASDSFLNRVERHERSRPIEGEDLQAEDRLVLNRALSRLRDQEGGSDEPDGVEPEPPNDDPDQDGSGVYAAGESGDEERDHV